MNDISPNAFPEPLNNDEEAVFNLLLSCPAWETIGSEDDEKKQLLMSQFESISKYKSDPIRNAMKHYAECILNSCDTRNDISMFTLVLLNRYLFAVPEWLEKSEFNEFPFYGSIRVPEEGDRVNLLWPLAPTGKNGFTLASEFYANSGPLPNALAEFDVFEERFGRRK